MAERPLKFDGLDAAIIGVTDVGQGQQLVVYDRAKIVAVYTKAGMTRAEAQEYIDFNVLGSHAGPGTPLVLERMTREEFRIWEEMIDDDHADP